MKALERLRHDDQRGDDIEICILASGSDGNATYMRSGECALLIDCGLPAREIKRRMGVASLDEGFIEAILLTHEHADHVRGAGPLSRSIGATVYATEGTNGARSLNGVSCTPVRPGVPFDVGPFVVTGFSLPHGAREPVGYVVSDGDSRLGYATDIGSVTLDLLAALDSCDAIILESNHDPDMLATGPYPAFLKKWIKGPAGHLSNEDTALVIEAVAHGGLKHLVLAHLSKVNNTPELSVSSAKRVLRGSGGARITVASHDEPSEKMAI